MTAIETGRKKRRFVTKFCIRSVEFVFFCRVNFATTNNLGDVLFRGEAVSRVSDSDRTSPTTWVYSRSLSPEIIEKNSIPKALFVVTLAIIVSGG